MRIFTIFSESLVRTWIEYAFVEKNLLLTFIEGLEKTILNLGIFVEEPSVDLI